MLAALNEKAAAAVDAFRADRQLLGTICVNHLSTEGNTGYPGATDGDSDPQCTAEAVNLFVSDMIVCLDR